MKRILKRASALALALVMCAGMMTTTAFAACAHEWDNNYVRAGSCETICNGYQHCTKCGTPDLTHPKQLSPIDHVAGSGVDIFQDKGNGTHTAKCANCGIIFNQKHFVDTEATCTTGPKCICGNSMAGEPLGHSLKLVEAVSATCTTVGNEEHYKCERCDALFENETDTEPSSKDFTIAALGHTLTNHEAKDATCTEAGNLEYWTCSGCNQLFADKDATKETTLEAVTIAALGHKLDKTEAKAATCTEDGNLEYWTCSACKELFADKDATEETTSADVIIPAKGHKAAEGWVATDPNQHWHACANCNADDDTAKFNVAPHSYSWVSDGNGGYNGTCECGKTVHSDGAPAHTCVFADTWTSANGQHFHECTVYPECHETKDAAAHNSEVSQPAVAATCLNTGWTEELTCSVCGTVTQEQAETAIDPSNHDDGCTASVRSLGVDAGHASVRTCGARVGAASAHTWGAWQTVTARLQERYCTVCNAYGTRTVTPVLNPGTGTDPTEPTAPVDPTDPDDGLTDIEDETAPLAGLPFDLAPTDVLSRGLFAQILYWFEGEPEADGKAPFTDVEGHEYAQAITWGAVNGILLGYEDDTYRPDNGITRGEMELILNRYALYKESEHTVKLDGEAGDVMIWLEVEGILDDFFAALDAEAE